MSYHREIHMSTLQDLFGPIDIYLFDQLLRGRIAPGMRIFDAGCGGGRNLVYLAREGYELSGVDADPRAVEATRRVVPRGYFRVKTVEAHTFPVGYADVAISSAVLH